MVETHAPTQRLQRVSSGFHGRLQRTTIKARCGAEKWRRKCAAYATKAVPHPWWWWVDKSRKALRRREGRGWGILLLSSSKLSCDCRLVGRQATGNFLSHESRSTGIVLLYSCCMLHGTLCWTGWNTNFEKEAHFCFNRWVGYFTSGSYWFDGPTRQLFQ